MVEEYNRREQEIKNMEKELDEKSNALNTYRQNIAEVSPDIWYVSSDSLRWS